MCYFSFTECEEGGTLMEKTMIPAFTEEDFKTEAPFEYLYSIRDNQFEMLQARDVLSAQAKKAGIRNFTTLFKAYLNDVKKKNDIVLSNCTEFDGQPILLNCGKWEATNDGIYCYDRVGYKVQVCSHPILPVRRMQNIESGTEKMEIAFKRGNSWKTMIVDKKTLSSNTSILELSAYGVAVTSENARLLVSYLSDLESINYDIIPEVKSTTKMGWVEDGVFAPYSDEVEFDGEVSFKGMYDAICQNGDFNQWVDLCRKVRGNSLYARIVLASSFASVLIKDCKLLPFFVHLWGGTETGKTVSLMLAASVWGNPEIGKYAQTFNSTFVAQEMLAGFVNNMPLIMDELQIIKDRDSFDEMIYKLTEGAGKNRGKKTGGLQQTQTWRNCIITTGEYPIVNSYSGGGAVNRIIEIDCKSISFFNNPKKVVDIITENYGFAGKKFVEYLSDKKHMDEAVKYQKEFYSQLERLESTAKQAASASVILAADKIATDLIFKDSMALTVDDIAPLLVSKFKTSQNERAYEYICDCIDINKKKFQKNEFGEYANEIWGVIEGKMVYIIKTKFDEMLENGGFNSKSFISWGIENGKIKPKDSTVYTVVKRIDGSACRCMAVLKETEEKPKKKKERVEWSVVNERKNEEDSREDIFADFDFDDSYAI